MRGSGGYGYHRPADYLGGYTPADYEAYRQFVALDELGRAVEWLPEPEIDAEMRKAARAARRELRELRRAGPGGGRAVAAEMRRYHRMRLDAVLDGGQTMFDWQETENGNLMMRDAEQYRAVVKTEESAAGGHWWAVFDANTGERLESGSAASVDGGKAAAAGSVRRHTANGYRTNPQTQAFQRALGG